MSQNYIYGSDDSGDLLVWDETGTQVDSHNEEGAGRNIHQTPDYVYTAYYESSQKLRQYSKNGTDIIQEWEIEPPGNEDLFTAPNQDILYASGNSGNTTVYRYSKTDGTEIWSSTVGDYAEDELLRGGVALSNGNFAIAIKKGKGDYQHKVREIDGSGNQVNEILIDSGSNSSPNGISRDNDDNYVVHQGGYLSKWDPDTGNKIWTADTSQYDNESLTRDNKGIYYVTEPVRSGYGKITSVNDDGVVQVPQYDDGGAADPQSYSSLIFTETGTLVSYFTENRNLVAVDFSGPTEEWKYTSGTTVYGDGYTLSASPSYTAHPEEWEYAISGNVVQNGSGVSGAKIFIVDDTNGELLTTTTTDSNGDWSATAPSTEIHVSAQYTDGNGDEYNAKSLPYISI